MNQTYSIIQRRFKPGELFQAEQLKTKSVDLETIKSDLFELRKAGLVKSFAYGIFFMPNKNPSLTPTAIDAIRLRYIESQGGVYGFFSGKSFIRFYLNGGLSDEDELEVVTNKATSIKKKVYMFSKRFTLRKPYSPVTGENVDTLAFLTYLSGASIDEVKANSSTLSNYIRERHLKAEDITSFASSVPGKAFKKLIAADLYRNLWKR